MSSSAWPALVLAILLPPAGSQEPSQPSDAFGSVSGTLGTIDGFLWEDGTWSAPFVSGDELHLVGTFEGGNDPFFAVPWYPASNTYTLWIRGMIATDEACSEGDRSVSYRGGMIGIYREPMPKHHDYGGNPPNGSSPTTFSDGELVLECSIDGGILGFNRTNGTGRLSLWGLQYVGGGLLDAVTERCGVCRVELEAVLAPDAPARDAVPAGYDFGFSGTLRTWISYGEAPPWEDLRALYR